VLHAGLTSAMRWLSMARCHSNTETFSSWLTLCMVEW